MQTPRVLPVILALLAATLAGCVLPDLDESGGTAAIEASPAGFAPFTVPKPSFDFAAMIDPDHVLHHVPHLHEKGHGLSLVGQTGVQSILPPGVRGSITQIDVRDGYAVVSGMEGDMGFVIVDIRDPAAPKPVSWFPSPGNDWTAKFSEDGNYVFAGCQIIHPFTTGAIVRGSCEDVNELHGGIESGGILAVDVTDKTKPTLVAFHKGSRAHNLQTAFIDGYDYVFTNGVNILRFDRELGRLDEVATVPGVHDASVMRHPATGDWLLYTGTRQISIWNVNDPAKPELVFEGPMEGVVGWHEQTPFPQLVDGRALLALAGESFSSTAGVPDFVSIVDVTDPAHPELLGTWKPPFESRVPWVSYLYSAHEMAATPQGQLAISWYHAGVWVLDVSTEERMRAPVAVAAYQPNALQNVAPATFAQTPLPYVPFVWGAGWDQRGYLVVPDMHTGVYVLEPDWGLLAMMDSGQ